jgi:Flp pilus assembly protein TadG
MIRKRTRRDAGSASIELAILAPAILILLAVTIFAGRVSLARQAVDAAAFDAARTASLARTGDEARTAGAAAGRSTLTSLGLSCRGVRVTISGDFGKSPGQPGTVTAQVSCRAGASDLGLPGVPGSRTLTGTFTSPIDTYRGRS